MRTTVFTLILTCLSLTSYGQTSTVTFSNVTRPVPIVGHNVNFSTKPSWGNQSFIDSVRALNMEIMRYPGGTSSQYFDWQTGRAVPDSLWTNGTLFSYAYIGLIPHISFPLSELLYFYQQTSIKPIFCLNLLTKSLSDQIQMLQTASSLGIPVEFIELGNELYFTDIDFVNKYPNPIDYVLDIKNNWLPQLSGLFPDAQIAVIGSYDGLTDLNGNPVPDRIHTWNDSIYAQNLTSNAIAFHYYFPPNTTFLGNPIVAEALASPFRNWPTLQMNSVNNVPNGMECWVTEYNLNDGNQVNYAIASSWTHGLYTASIFSLLLEEPKITMLLNHQITGSPSFASLASYTPFGDTLTNRLTAEGNAMRLLHQAVNGNVTATKLDFSINPTITVNTTNYPSLLGWVFDNGADKELYVLNLSNTNFTLDLSPIVSGTFEYEIISSIAPLQKDITTQDLVINKGTSNTTIQSVPYSLMYVNDPNIVHSHEAISSVDFSIFPNPAKNLLLLNNMQQQNELVRVQIFDNQGRLISVQECRFNNGSATIDLAEIPEQLLFIKVITENGKQQSYRILKD